MTELLLKFLVILVIIFILYLSFTTSKVKEGLTSSNSSSPTSSSSNSSNTTNGIAGNSAAYASLINSQTTKLDDALLTSKYQQEYESIITSMQNYICSLSLNLLCSINQQDIISNDITSSLEKLNTYNNAQTSLVNLLKVIKSS